jgi:hypothetical protein
MERESQPCQTDLTGVHINLEAGAIEFEDRHGTVGRLLFTGESVLYEGQPLLLTPMDQRATPRQQPAPPPNDQLARIMH